MNVATLVSIANVGLWVCITVLAIYTLRHYFFTLNRLFGKHRQPFVDILQADWPSLVVFVPAHNESRVVRDSLDALLTCDYPEDRLKIVPIDDRSTDDTRAILVEYAENYPGRVIPFLRDGGTPGKAAALADAMEMHTDEIFLVFDADYIPGTRLLKQLVAPFFDPEVGAVMGRVVPLNVGLSLLTRLLDLERAGGYQVDQQARMNLRLVPQYGGTVGGVRRVALENVGGWRTDSLAEDTDLTVRLVIAGWDVVYQNRSECYEEVPETWESRIRQIKRWAKGHNQALRRYVGAHSQSQRSAARTGSRRCTAAGRVRGTAHAARGLVLHHHSLLRRLSAAVGTSDDFAISSFNTVGNFAAFFQWPPPVVSTDRVNASGCCLSCSSASS